MAMGMGAKCVDLGFVEKAHPNALLSHLFPSKVGGKPAWLSLRPLPANEVLACGVCSRPCVFLLQIYAPLETETCFHRMFFLFICRDPNCCKTNNNANLVVLRSQLPRENDFYSGSPPEHAYEDGVIPVPAQFSSVCVVCGCAGGKRCAVCHQASYCSKHHQTMHWKAGHKHACKQGEHPHLHAHKCDLLFEEYEILIEDEVLTKSDEKEAESDDDEKPESECTKEYAEYLKSQTSKDDPVEFTAKELEKMALSDDQVDKTFAKFRQRIRIEPEQILRYDRGGDPLFVSDEFIPAAEDIPPCQCGAPRTFEFQVVSHLLHHLGVDSLCRSVDWGTLVVYTCSKSCDIGNNYVTEHVFKQDFSNTEIPEITQAAK